VSMRVLVESANSEHECTCRICKQWAWVYL